jgi:ubiquinol-cytochrome c reductase cytochrome b subunit
VTRLVGWLEARLGLGGAARRFLEKPVPERLPWSQTLGAVALLLFGVQAVTGIGLALYYAPTPDHAHESLRWLESAVNGGRLLRALHHWGASFLVVAVVLHLLRVFLHGAYRAPRELNWVAGVKLLLLVLAFGLTGYLLPWDQKAFWATRVTLNIAETVPLAGPFLARVLSGGDTLGALTLTRFYALHILVLPALALLLVIGHVALVQRHGTAGPPRGGESGAEVDAGRSTAADAATGAERTAPTSHRTEPFHPRQTFRDAVACALVFALLFGTALLRPAPLEALADPTDSSYVPRPEWYFLPLFQLLKYFPGRLELIGTVLLPGLGTALLFALPWIDRGSDRRVGARKLVVASGLFVFAAAAGLTVLGLLDPGGAPEPAWRTAGRTPFFAMAGPRIAGERDCAGCHRADGFGSGPPLEGAAWTRSRSWIRAHVSDPEFVAPGAREPEDPLSTPETSLLVAWLELVRDGEPPSPAGADSAAVDLILREGCAGCHRFDGTGGTNGPDFEGVGSRRSVDWVVNYLPDPEAIDPEATMKAYPDLSLEDRTTIARFLARYR